MTFFIQDGQLSNKGGGAIETEASPTLITKKENFFYFFYLKNKPLKRAEFMSRFRSLLWPYNGRHTHVPANMYETCHIQFFVYPMTVEPLGRTSVRNKTT